MYDLISTFDTRTLVSAGKPHVPSAHRKQYMTYN